MPLESAAEALFKFIFRLVLDTLGYATGWLLIPTLSLGYYTVEPLSPPKRGNRAARTRRPLPARQLSVEATSAIGGLFWVLLLAAYFGVWWLTGRPALSS